MKRLTTFLFLLIPALIFAQNQYSKYNWTTLPYPGNGDTIKSVDGAAILLERRISEIYINRENNFEETFVFHKKIRVETNQAINVYNKIYVSLNKVIDIIDIAARFISPDGKITNLSKENIKEIKNLDDKGNYKTFVVEGAETGGQIEYYYVLKKEFNPYGGYFVQDETPRANVEVIFSYPSKLVYMFRGNCGFPEFIADETNKDQTIQRAYIAYVPGIPEEKYASYKANMMNFEYTMAFNHFTSSIRAYSWAKACNNIYNNTFILSKKEKPAVKALLDKMGITAGTVEEKVRAIENYVKKNFEIDKNFDTKSGLNENIKLKQCNFFEAGKLFVALFQEAGIPFEILKTSDKTTTPFLPDFDAFNFMDNTLFYFPDINKYLSPEDNSFRLGLIPGEFQGAYGIFMKPLIYNATLQTLGYEIRQIPYQSCWENGDSLFIQVSVEPENSILKTKTKRIMFGEFGRIYQSFLHFMDDTKKKEMVESIFSMGKDHTDVLSMNYENSAPENIGVKPIIWNVELQSKSLIEEAGNDLLIKIGETIGQQSELYQENKRVLPVSVGILHDYYRKITFVIPEGYKLANLNDLNMHVEMKNNGKTSCIFTSEASLSNNLLTIISKEYYTEPEYPASLYEDFRKVINAAADFNKKTLLLQKI